MIRVSALLAVGAVLCVPAHASMEYEGCKWIVNYIESYGNDVVCDSIVDEIDADFPPAILANSYISSVCGEFLSKIESDVSEAVTGSSVAHEVCSTLLNFEDDDDDSSEGSGEDRLTRRSSGILSLPQEYITSASMAILNASNQQMTVLLKYNATLVLGDGVTSTSCSHDATKGAFVCIPVAGKTSQTYASAQGNYPPSGMTSLQASSGPSSSSNGGGTSAAAIVGAVLGVIAVVGVVALFAMQHRGRAQISQRDAASVPLVSTEGDATDYAAYSETQ